MSLFDSIVSGVVGAGAKALFGGIANNYASDRDWSRNAAMSWEMWNANNRYNSPVEVMKRYRDAGLNPNLIYGQMPQASQPAVVHSNTKPVDVDVNWMLANQLENSELNNDLTREEIKNKVEQHNINDAVFAETLARTALTKKKTELEDKYFNDKHAMTLAQIAEVSNRSKELDIQAAKLAYDLERSRSGDAVLNKILDFVGLGGKPEEAPAKIEAVKVAGTTMWTVGTRVFSSYIEAKKALAAIQRFRK